MDYEPTKNEQILIDVLERAGAHDEVTAIAPSALIQHAKALGLDNPKAVDDAIMSLIDHDIVEYDMDDQAEVASMWLLED